MCGITFVHRLDKQVANKSILKRYHKQKSRGSDGFGYIAIKGNKLKSYKRAKLESQIKTFIDKEDAETILFHHRFPTSTPNFSESAHPIKVSSIDLKYDYYLVHNGIISNADELKTKHEALGFSYNTEIVEKYLTSGQTYKSTCFNDSEALAIEVALAIDTNSMKIEAKGSIAFIVAKVHKSSNNIVAIYFARNVGNPLKYSKSNNLISIGSESEGKMVESGFLCKLDLKTGDVVSQKFEMPEYRAYSYGAGYDYNRDYEYPLSKDPADTTFGGTDEDDEFISKWGFDVRQDQLRLDGKKVKGVTEAMMNRWNELDFEINAISEQLDKLEDNNDGSPQSENTIIELEAILNSLESERDVLDEAITTATLASTE